MSAAEPKSIGLFLPVRDVMNMWRGYRIKCVSNTELDHRDHVAIDVKRLITNVMPPGSYASKSETHDSVAKLLILHLGQSHQVLFKYFFDDSVMDKIADYRTDFFVDWTNFAPDSDYERNNPASVDPMYWIHLFEYLSLDLVRSPGSTQVIFNAQKGHYKTDMSPVKDMPTLAYVYGRASKYGVKEQDLFFVYFIASALRLKSQGLDALMAAREGKGIDATHARLQNVPADQIRALWSDMNTGVGFNFNQESAPSESHSQALTVDHFQDDWAAVINFMRVNLPEIGNVKSYEEGAMMYTSTDAGERRLLQEEKADLEADGADGDVDEEAGDFDEEAGDFDEEDEMAYDRPLPDVPDDDGLEEVERQIGAARSALSKAPLVKDARTKWGASREIPSRKIAGALVLHHLLSAHQPHQRAAALQRVNGSNPLGVGAPLSNFERPIAAHRIEHSQLAAVDFYQTMRQVGGALGSYEPDVVREFSNAVYTAPGVLYSERPITAADRIADYLTVYGCRRVGGAWSDVWRGGAARASSALRSAVDAFKAKKPHTTVEQAVDIARRI